MLKEDLDVLLHELKSFDPSLERKRMIIAVTKTDIIDPPTLKKLQSAKLGRREVHYISAVSGKGVRDLVEAMDKALRKPRRASRSSAQEPV